MSQPALSSITVAGFKSIGSPQTIEIAPLTILAGANNSGKSSIMQPLLLLKQTLLAPVDPGGLLVQGPLLRFAPLEIWHRGRQAETNFQLDLHFQFEGGEISLQFKGAVEGALLTFVKLGSGAEHLPFVPADPGVSFVRFLPYSSHDASNQNREARTFAQILQRLIHLPTVRRLNEAQVAAGRPQSIEDRFDSYVAPIVRTWQDEKGSDIERLQEALKFLGVYVRVEYDLDARPQMQVSVFPEESGDRQLLARPSQVGFGITQALPIVVALLYAKPGDLVHIEEPEAHLHPKAQIALTRLIADAARRGIRVVIETHSSLILREVQTIVAAGDVSPSTVKLHWFHRDPSSFETRVTSASLDEQGTFGDWPEDFDEVNLDSEKRFLDATFSRGPR